MKLSFETILSAIALAVMPISVNAQTEYQPVQDQFIAALADPTATSGTGAQNWGFWAKDPGPRGV